MVVVVAVTIIDVPICHSCMYVYENKIRFDIFFFFFHFLVLFEACFRCGFFEQRIVKFLTISHLKTCTLRWLLTVVCDFYIHVCFHYNHFFYALFIQTRLRQAFDVKSTHKHIHFYSRFSKPTRIMLTEHIDYMTIFVIDTNILFAEKHDLTVHNNIL